MGVGFVSLYFACADADNARIEAGDAVGDESSALGGGSGRGWTRADGRHSGNAPRISFAAFADASARRLSRVGRAMRGASFGTPSPAAAAHQPGSDGGGGGRVPRGSGSRDARASHRALGRESMGGSSRLREACSALGAAVYVSRASSLAATRLNEGLFAGGVAASNAGGSGGGGGGGGGGSRGASAASSSVASWPRPHSGAASAARRASASRAAADDGDGAGASPSSAYVALDAAADDDAATLRAWELDAAALPLSEVRRLIVASTLCCAPGARA